MPRSTLADILSPSTLARIDNYLLMARVVVEGFIAGMHRSVYHGFGSEFLQYRNYTPGDDLKYVDWKVFARSNRFYTKVFQEETNMNCTLVVDASASMGYRGEDAACSKFHYGAMIAASLAYLASCQGDSVGLHIYGDELATSILPRNRGGHLHRICTSLAAVKTGGAAAHERFLPYITETLQRRGLVVFISDFMDADETLPPLLKRVRCTGSDCIVFQVLDPDEKSLPFNGTIRFFDSESGETIVTAPENVRTVYQQDMAGFLGRVRRGCHGIQADYLLTDSGESLGHVLAAYLHRRGGVY